MLSQSASEIATSFGPPESPLTAKTTGRLVPTTTTEALNEMTAVIGEARGALLATVDGRTLAHSDTMPNNASHAAMLAAALGLCRQLVLMGGGDQLRQLVIDHDNGLLLLWPIGDTRVLAMLTESTVDQTRLGWFVGQRAPFLADT